MFWGDGHRTPVASADSAKLVHLHQASIDPLQHIRDQLKANQVLWDGAHCLQGSLGNALSELALGRNCVETAKSILTAICCSSLVITLLLASGKSKRQRAQRMLREFLVGVKPKDLS